MESCLRTQKILFVVVLPPLPGTFSVMQMELISIPQKHVK
jgi:hypothetical protein